MAEQIDLEDILARNPHIDRDQVEEAREMLRRLRACGVRRKGYDLAPPFGGHRASFQDPIYNNPRLDRAGASDDESP